MPSPYISKLAKETGTSTSEIEKLWDKAKALTSEEFGIDVEDFSAKEYKYTTGIVKNMLGMDERVIDPTGFLNSGRTAREYIETVVSGNFSIGNVKPPKEKDEELDDEVETDDYDEEDSGEISIEDIDEEVDDSPADYMDLLDGIVDKDLEDE